MPRSLLNRSHQESCVVNPLCQTPAPAPAPHAEHTALAAGGYLELHGTSVDWRLKVENERLVAQRRGTDNQWNTRFSFT